MTNELGGKWNSYCNCIFLPKEGGTQAIFTCYWMNSKIFVHSMGNYCLGSDYLLLHTYSCLIGTLSSKGCNTTLGGSLGPATETTHLWLNQPLVFSNVCTWTEYSVVDLGGVRGVQMHPLWQLVMYFCVHNFTSTSNDYAAVACSNNNQAQLYTHSHIH